MSDFFLTFLFFPWVYQAEEGLVSLDRKVSLYPLGA